MRSENHEMFSSRFTAEFLCSCNMRRYECNGPEFVLGRMDDIYAVLLSVSAN